MMGMMSKREKLLKSIFWGMVTLIVIFGVCFILHCILWGLKLIFGEYLILALAIFGAIVAPILVFYFSIFADA